MKKEKMKTLFDICICAEFEIFFLLRQKVKLKKKKTAFPSVTT